MIKTMIQAALLLIAIGLFYSVAQARTYATPAGTTCATVKYYYASLGGMAGVLNYAKTHNITLTPWQRRAALKCLKT